jgi:predicted CXXCH cytochrome family protein
MHFKRNIIFFLFITFIVSGTMMVQQCKPRDSAGVKQDTVNSFVGDKQCKSCHENEYKAWFGSGHFKAMMPAGDSSVSGDFNNKTLVADGVTSHFYKKEGKYFINTEGEDGRNHDFEVKYTFGYFPLQQYLVEFPGGRMQASRVSWDLIKKKWFNQYGGQKIPAHNWLHWTGNAQNWNTMCAGCHSTNLQKNYNIETDSYHTTYSSINVSCETCHGAGQRHIEYVKGSDYLAGKKIAGSLLLNPKNVGQIAEINTCAICHSRKSDISPNPTPGAPMMENYIPEIPTTEHFYADGQANDEDYNYTSFTESKMFRQGVKCTNCHEPHTAKLLFPGNQLCAQCHAKTTFDNPSHTFHPIGSAGAECKNCHMPGKYYMGIDFRYDHVFRVPRPDLSVRYGTPNACNNCHQNKTALWASEAVKKWYGPVRKYHFAEDLIPGSRIDEHSEAHLIKLLGDTSVPDVIKATSASYLGSIQTSNSLYALKNCLNMPDANIRYRALRSLASFPPQQWIYAAAPLLKDDIRAVRIAAADLFLTIPENQIPPDYAKDFVRAKSELESYNFYQADFAVGNVLIGDFYLKQNDYVNAEKYYRRGLRKDSLMNYARLNLSVAYNMSKQNDQALQALLDAVKIDPKNERTYYNLALLYNEMGKREDAARAFSKAVELKTTNPRLYYNYALLLQQMGKSKLAAEMYNKGLAISPADAQLNYALSLLYLQGGQPDKARVPAAVLKKYYPDNPEYQKIFKYLNL